MTGLELAAAIRIEWPETPILLVSGYAELPSLDPLRIPKLAKPYSNDDLRNAIDSLVQKGDLAGKTFESTYRR